MIRAIKDSINDAFEVIEDSRIELFVSSNNIIIVSYVEGMEDLGTITSDATRVNTKWRFRIDRSTETISAELR